MEVDECSGENHERQIVNSIGGFVRKVDDMKRLHRFLVLGCESPTYYIGERLLGIENATAITNLLKDGKGVQVVNDIRRYSIEGRTVKQNPIMLALALCARTSDLATKRRAYEVLPEVCRIPTHLFMFIGYCQTFSSLNGEQTTGWGRAHRNAIKKWYISNSKKDPMKLATNITKYQKREGWSHRDVARLMHLKPTGQDVCEELGVMMRYVARGWNKVVEVYCSQDTGEPHIINGESTNAVLQFLRAVENVKGMTAADELEVVQFICNHNLVREHIPTQCLNSVEVWRALLTNMPMKAMIQSLGKMTSVGLLNEHNVIALDMVCKRLRDWRMLKNARLHPLNVLFAWKTYKNGRGYVGKLRWTPNGDIVNALEEALYLSFKHVESTKKRHLLAIDVSVEMSDVSCASKPFITPCFASAVMAMVVAKTESDHHFVAFSDRIVPLTINENITLNQVLHAMASVPGRERSLLGQGLDAKASVPIPMGGTDCALPMLYAIENNLAVDVFVVYTDCETRTVTMQPSAALKQYRRHSGIRDAKLIVVNMTSNGFTFADPDDPGMFDMAGFDCDAPQVMREFILGDI